jgi:hypothetical protein
MPRFDKTGPMGQGSQTGRKAGKCNPETEMHGRGRLGLFKKAGMNKQNNAGDGGNFGRERGLGRRNRGI